MTPSEDLVPGYDLHRPTIHDLESTLTQVLGPREAQSHMSRAVHELELDHVDRHALSLDELLLISDRLTRERGLVSVLARSFWIRLSNWKHLSQSGAQQ